MAAPITGTGNQPQPPFSQTLQPVRGERPSFSAPGAIPAAPQGGENAKNARAWRGTLVDILV